MPLELWLNVLTSQEGKCKEISWLFLQEENGQDFFFLFQKDTIYFYLKIRSRERQREGEFFHPLAHSSNGLNNQNWAALKLGARNRFQVSHRGEGAQGHEPSSTAFSGHKHGTGLEMEEKPGLKRVPIWDTGTSDRELTYYATMSILSGCFSCKLDHTQIRHPSHLCPHHSYNTEQPSP